MSIKRHLRLRIGAIWDQFLRFLQPEQLELTDSLLRICGGGESLLDLGCGDGHHWGNKTPHFSERIGVDIHSGCMPPSGLYTSLINSSILDFLKTSKSASFDVVVASCVIEHLEKRTGYELLVQMARVCRRTAVVFTPNGYVPQPPDTDNPSNQHLSGWSTDDFQSTGYSVIAGINGFKNLRTTYALPVIKPVWLGELTSRSSARIAFKFPKLAYQILLKYEKIQSQAS